jgi:hypothetical protein
VAGEEQGANHDHDRSRNEHDKCDQDLLYGHGRLSGPELEKAEIKTNNWADIFIYLELPADCCIGCLDRDAGI